jgi:two-component system, cell cycle sensor histidine kinase and response regulator CckA
VVDDIMEQRELTLDMLIRLVYRVHTLPRGEAALVYLRTHTADLVVLDMIMDPGMDGLETCRRMREGNPNQKAVNRQRVSETSRMDAASRRR